MLKKFVLLKSLFLYLPKSSHSDFSKNNGASLPLIKENAYSIVLLLVIIIEVS